MKFLFLFFVSTLILFSFSRTAVADNEYEEVTYEELVQRISEKKSQLAHTSTAPSSSLDNLMIHAGFGLVTAINSININGHDTYKQQNGFQISLGIDLFSENFMAEGALRNFGQSHSGTETRSLREFDLKLTFKDKHTSQAGFHLSSGLGTRIFKLTDSASGRYINDTTPSFFFAGGVDAFVSKSFSLGFEAGWRTALVTSTVDKNGLDATLRMDTSF